MQKTLGTYCSVSLINVNKDSKLVNPKDLQQVHYLLNSDSINLHYLADLEATVAFLYEHADRLVAHKVQLAEQLRERAR